MANPSEFLQESSSEQIEILESYVLDSRVNAILDNPEEDSIDGN
jgi:hypothetical protein